MAEEFGWDISEKGTLLSGFYYGYILTQILGALFSRRFGGHLVLGVAAFSWSLCTILVPFAASKGTFFLFLNRVSVGLFEGFAFPVVFHLFALNVPESERSRAIGILSVHTSFGAVLAFYLSPLIINRYGWRSVFTFFGVLGMIWTIIWISFWAFNHFAGFDSGTNNGQNIRLKAKERLRRVVSLRDEIRNRDTETMKTVKEVSQLLKHKPVWAILCCHFNHNIGHYVILSWLPTFLDSMGVKGEALSITCVPYILMACFALLFGACADRMLVRPNVGKNSEEYVSGVRRFWTITCFTGSASCLILLTFFTGSKDHLYFVMFFLSLALGLNSACPVAGYESAKLDLVESSKVGLLQAVSNTFATLSGILGVPIVSFIYKVSNSWTPVFWWISLMFLSAAFVFYKYGRWKQKIVF